MMMRAILRRTILAGTFALPFIVFLVSGSLFFPFITTKAFTFRIIVEIIFAAWFVLALLDKNYRPRLTPIFYALASFLLIIGLADILGVAPVKSFWSNFERMEGFITLLHLGALFLVMSSVFGADAAKRVSLWNRWFNTTLVASGLMVVYCLFQLAGAITINQGGVRVDGTLGNASYLAVYMLMHIFIAALLLAGNNKKSKYSKFIYGALIAGQVFILYHTATRGAILGLLGGIFILAILNIRNKQNASLRKISIGLLVSLVVIVGAFFALLNTSFVQDSPVLSRFASISTEELKSGGRSFIWPMAIEGVKEKPILGWGQENFSYVFNEHYSPDMYAIEPWFDRAHNIFLDWAVAGGLLGLLAYLSLYGALLFEAWKSQEFSYAEKSVITGLVAAYFFHNLFVFDNLISYIMFFSLLAYVQSASKAKVLLENAVVGESKVINLAAPLAAIMLLLVLYFGNARQISANASLISALRYMQMNQLEVAVDYFEKSYNASTLGQTEIAGQMSNYSLGILRSTLPIEEKNDFFHFVAAAVQEQAQTFPSDARVQLIAGDFLSRTGQFEEALSYLNKAVEIMPEKQDIHFSLGETYLRMGDLESALKEFKAAYDMAPQYTRAGLMYLVASVYAGDQKQIQELLSNIPLEAVLSDGRFFTALVETDNKSSAISILNNIEENHPEYKNEVEKILSEIK